jgi:putative PIN family toxin of toxin-antitoxin system
VADAEPLRAVLDPNVIISALLSPDAPPARTLRGWQEGRFELVVSQLLLAELERALAYPKLRKRVTADEAEQLVDWLRSSAEVAPDPPGPPTVGSRDPGDDYLLALAESERAALVSGDRELLARTYGAPVFSPAAFLEFLEPV